MKLHVSSVLLMISLVTAPLNSQVDPVPNEDNCRNAINAGLEMLLRIQPDITQRDDEARKKLLEEMKQLVETNRQQGVSECRTWARMMDKAFNQ